MSKIYIFRSFLILLVSAGIINSGISQISIIETMDSGVPSGWTNAGFWSSSTTAPCEGSGSIRDNLYSSSTTGSITSPNFAGASNGTDVAISFQWRTTEFSAGNGVDMSAVVEYSTDDGASYLPLGGYSTTVIEPCAAFNATIPAASIPTGTDFKFRITGNYNSGDFYHWVDDLFITQTITAVPNCDVALTSATTDFPIDGTITWSAATGAPSGYFITIGSTSGGSDIANMVDVLGATSYVPSGLVYDQTYFVTITPYNGNGNATGCTEETFVVEADPSQIVPCGSPLNTIYCYGSNDDSQFVYVSSDGISPLTITFNAGGIESCCDDILIYDGTSTSDPLLFSGSNGGDLSGVTATSSGIHLLLVVDSDSSFDCDSGSDCCATTWDWDVECATCSPPVFTVADGGNNCPLDEFLIDVTITSLGDATTVNITNNGGAAAINGVDGTANPYSIGPFAGGTTVTVSVTDAADPTCDAEMSFTTTAACPPAEDVCSGSINIPVTLDMCTGVTTGNNTNATDSNNDIPAPPAATCTGYNGGDIWFDITVPASGNVTISGAASPSCCSFLWYEIYTGADCGSLTSLDCSATTGNDPSQFEKVLTGLVGGSTIWIRAWDSSNDNGPGDFNFCAFESVPLVNNECSGAIGVNVGSISGSNVGANNMGNPGSCAEGSGGIPGAAGVWYVYNSTGSEEITIDLCSATDTDFDTKLHVYDGDCTTLNCVASNDDFCATTSSTNRASSVTFASAANFAPVDYFILVSGFGTGSGNFMLNVASAPLPIELLSFNGAAMEEGNKLTWSTATELNTEFHVIERSIDGLSGWAEIGRVQAAGSSFETLEYSFMDEKPLAKGYYRLLSVDLDKSKQLSEVLSLERAGAGFTIAAAFPNPTQEMVTVQYHSPKNVSVEVAVTDISGRIVQMYEVDANNGINSLELNMTNLASGTYFLSLSNSIDKVVERIVKQ